MLQAVKFTKIDLSILHPQNYR